MPPCYAPFANPEDRIRDLVMNIEEIKTILDDIQMSLEEDEEYDNASEALISIERTVELLDDAVDELEEAADLLEL